jgi:AraC-like DNA-binding protein
MELGIILSGSLERNSGDHRQVLNAGDVWLHTIWEPHGYQILNVPCETVVIVFRPELLFGLKLFNQSFDWFSFFYEKPSFRPQTDNSNRKEILEIGSQVKRLSLKENLINLPLLQTYLIQLLIYLSQNRQLRKRGGSPDADRILRIQPALKLAFSSELYLPEKLAAKACNLSISTFRKEFQELVNVSFPRFTLRFRLRQSALTLRQTSLSIKETAYKYGFFDLSHFYRDFKLYFGVTPKEYRNS